MQRRGALASGAGVESGQHSADSVDAAHCDAKGGDHDQDYQRAGQHGGYCGAVELPREGQRFRYEAPQPRQVAQGVSEAGKGKERWR